MSGDLRAYDDDEDGDNDDSIFHKRAGQKT